MSNITPWMQTENDAERLYQRLGGTRPAIFLDFDGVLVAIAPTPDAVKLEPEIRDSMLRLQRLTGGALAIVSGRSLREIDRLLGDDFPAAGDHGNERRRADGTVTCLNEAAAEAAARLARDIRAKTAGDRRLLVEEKASGVALHYRLAAERAAECEMVLTEAIAGNPAWSMIIGKMVVEARPSGVDKGAAVKAFMSEPPFTGQTPIMLGDDVTDEDGFAMAESLGGVGIKVGPGQTRASLRIADQEEVLPFLCHLADRLENRG